MFLCIVNRAIGIVVDSRGVDATGLNSMREVAVILLLLCRLLLWITIVTYVLNHIMLIKLAISFVPLSDIAIILLINIGFILHRLISFFDFGLGLFLFLRSYFLQFTFEFRRRVAIAHRFDCHHSLSNIIVRNLLLLQFDLFLLVIQHL